MIAMLVWNGIHPRVAAGSPDSSPRPLRRADRGPVARPGSLPLHGRSTGLSPASTSPPHRAAALDLRVTALLAQIVSWGSLYYSFSLFVLPMQTAGWSLTAINGALTAPCSSQRLCVTGRALDRPARRGRTTIGALAAVCYWSPGAGSNPGRALRGLDGSRCLHGRGAPVTCPHHTREQARRAITLTLVAGFASTVYMPLIELLLRQTTGAASSSSWPRSWGW